MTSPLIFLHGALGTGRSFPKVTESVSDALNMFAPDFPGHGSGPRMESLSTDNLADYVLGWMDDRNFKKISIFGHSLGGYIGLYLASHYPDRVERVFTFGTKMHWTPEFAGSQTSLLDPDVIDQKNVKLAEYLSNSHQNWKGLTRSVADYMRELGRSPSITNEDLAAIKCPVRMSVGDRDHMVTIEETYSTYKLIPGAEFQVFPNTRHDIEKLSPELFYQAWTHFAGGATLTR